jgi:subtilase family serine protease
MPRRMISLCAGAALLAGSMLTAGGTAVASGAPGVLPVPVAQFRLVNGVDYARPPTTAQCERQQQVACYAPFQYHRAYDLGPLYQKGFDGKGETIVIVDPFGYRFIRNELAVFDRAFRLPAPPGFRIIQPAGPVRGTSVGWAVETSLDVEYAHVMAPGANILLAETPAAEGLGTSGFPQIVKAENYVISHHLGTVISQSQATAEQTFPNAQSILRLRSAYQNAAASGVSVLAATGDQGPTSFRTNTTYFLRRVVCWPASDPLVTAVGGTQMHLTASGQHIQPDTVWNDSNLTGGPSASGGGRSAVFGRPAYQDGVAGIAGPDRVDVTAGTSTVTFPQGGSEHTVPGWDGVAGYDLASGVGTVNAALFVPELAAAADGS